MNDVLRNLYFALRICRLGLFVVFVIMSWLPEVLAKSSDFVGSDSIIFTQNSIRHELNGCIIVEAVDGGVLFRDQEARLWLVQPDEIESKSTSDTPVEYFSQAELSRGLLEELPEGFRVETTDNWVIAYNTERVYARYLGGLYERLLRGFTGHWKSKRKWKLPVPDKPLVAIIFKSFDEYAGYVKQDLGIEPPTTMVAYYNLMTNRVVMYDLTSTFQGAAKVQNDRQVHEILSNPNALAMVATVIHEGTHQLMFNLGMQQRLAATPLWVNEGLAMYFETPDMNSTQGWRAIGQVNTMRLTGFRQALLTKPRAKDALKTLLTDDEGFHDQTQLIEKYAESWAFNYFLLMRHDEEYVDYLKFLAEKEPLREDDAETKLNDFQNFFPGDLGVLDAEFVEYIRSLK